MSPPVSHTEVRALLRVSQVRGPQIHCLGAHQDKHRLALIQEHLGALKVPYDEWQRIELGAHDTGGMQRDQGDIKVGRGELVVLPTMSFCDTPDFPCGILVPWWMAPDRVAFAHWI